LPCSCSYIKCQISSSCSEKRGEKEDKYNEDKKKMSEKNEKEDKYKELKENE
jgi:hypothetical protein